MRKIYFFLLLLISTAVHAQENTNSYRNIVKLNINQLADGFNFPTVQFSFERKITPKISIIAEAGVQLYSLRSEPDTLFYKPRGFKANVEIRAYILQIINPKRFIGPTGPFIGIQPFYHYNKETFNIEYDRMGNVNYLDDHTLFSDDFGVKRKVYGVNLTLGYQKHLFKRWVIEPSIAIGYAYRVTQNVGRSFNPYTDESNFIHDVSGMESIRIDLYNGNDYNFAINFKIGYKF